MELIFGLIGVIIGGFISYSIFYLNFKKEYIVLLLNKSEEILNKVDIHYKHSWEYYKGDRYYEILIKNSKGKSNKLEKTKYLENIKDKLDNVEGSIFNIIVIYFPEIREELISLTNKIRDKKLEDNLHKEKYLEIVELNDILINKIIDYIDKKRTILGFIKI